MCLSIAVNHPSFIMAKGSHLGHEWNITHNGSGYLCGYVKVCKGHPWHGKSYGEIDEPVDVHGGLTFSEPDMPCGAAGPDDGHWFGFDCMQSGDAPIWELLTDEQKEYENKHGWRIGGTARTIEYVRRECERLCEAALASRADCPGE